MKRLTSVVGIVTWPVDRDVADELQLIKGTANKASFMIGLVEWTDPHWKVR